MFHWIVVNVFHVSPPVFFVSDQMFPKPSLPHRSPVVVVGTPLYFPRDGFFDFPPAPGKIRIARREAPDAVQMVRQHHDGVDMKGTLGHDLPTALGHDRTFGLAVDALRLSTLPGSAAFCQMRP